jgi:hypothetical protein
VQVTFDPQLVFTIPKRLRIYCRYDRSLLGELARAAWQATVEVYRPAAPLSVRACHSKTGPQASFRGSI